MAYKFLICPQTIISLIANTFHDFLIIFWTCTDSVLFFPFYSLVRSHRPGWSTPSSFLYSFNIILNLFSSLMQLKYCSLCCVLCVINGEPVDLSLPSVLVFYVWSMLNRLTYPFPHFYIVFYVWSMLNRLTYPFPNFLCFMCDQCWTGWPIPSLILWNTI
jgi:hypothetical protein